MDKSPKQFFVQNNPDRREEVLYESTYIKSPQTDKTKMYCMKSAKSPVLGEWWG